MKKNLLFAAIIMIGLAVAGCDTGLSHYSVTFDADGGTPAVKTLTVEPGGSVQTLPDSPTKDGFSFGGWFTKKNGAGSQFTASTKVNSDITVYAKWTAISAITVTFDADTGTFGSVSTVVINVDTAGYLTSVPPDPTKSGYSFAGWYMERNGLGQKFLTSNSVAQSITVYAYWTTAPVYTVTFILEGGTYNGSSIDPTIRVIGDNSNVGNDDFPANPVRDGFNFAGWWTSQVGGGTPFYATTPVNSNITVYANWVEMESFTVTFDANGGIFDNGSGQVQYTVKSGQSVGAFPSNPSIDGDNFGGWYSTLPNSDGSGGVPFYTGTKIYNNITVYAFWTQIVTYTVTFDTQGATDNPAFVYHVLDGQSVGADYWPSDTNASYQITKPGYIFNGWWTEQKGMGTQYFADTPITSNVTLYASWILPVYTVTFDADGGTFVLTDSGTYLVTTQYNSSISPPAETIPSYPPDPARDGYTFGGWYTQQNKGGNLFTTTTPVSQNMTVYAAWNINILDAVFDADGGIFSQNNSGTLTESVTFNDNVSLPNPNPTRQNYSFHNWWYGKNGTNGQFTGGPMPANGLYVYADWTLNYYDVTFDWGGGSPVSPSTYNVASGTAINPLPVTSWGTQYDFKGWFFADNTPFTNTTPVTGTCTVYAKWTPFVTATFLLNGGLYNSSSNAPSDVHFDAGGSFNNCHISGESWPDASKMSKTGDWRFNGWNSDTGVSGFTASTTVNTSSPQTITLTAQWQATVTVNFMPDQDDTAQPFAIVIADSGKSINETPGVSFPSDVPTKSGYTCIGWSVAPKSTTADFTADTLVGTSSPKFVYPVWQSTSSN